MSLLKFLVLLWFAGSVLAADNSGIIDFGLSSETADTPVEQPSTPSSDTDEGPDADPLRGNNPSSEVYIEAPVDDQTPAYSSQQPGTNDAYVEPVAPEMPADVTPNQAGIVKRSYFTSDIDKHEPVDNLLSLSNDHDYVYFYTDLRNFEGQTITHRWEYNNQVLAEVSFNVQGPRWRVWSRKTLLPSWVGEIHVNVVDEEDRILAAGVLPYTEASQ